MEVINVLAGVAVKDLSDSGPWYERLFGRPPDMRPMNGLLEWEFEKGGWLQVFEVKRGAGGSFVTLVETSVDDRIEDLKAKGIEIVSTSGADGDAVKTAIIKDPDGNQIVFARGVDDIHRSTM
ncbi:VOC family protein [Phyllobacterium sp. P5_D12]